MQQGRESALVTIADDLEADITDKKRVVIGNKICLKKIGQLRLCSFKIRSNITPTPSIIYDLFSYM